MLAASGPAFGAPRVRDIWHAYVADGQRYGSVHTVVARLPDGNYRITEESRLMLDVLGLQKEELTERGEYVVTPDYRPVSIACEGKRASGATQGRGPAPRRGIGGDRDGRGRRALPHLRARPTPSCPAACLDDWLADRPPDYQKGEITVLDEESCELRQATVKRRRAPPSRGRRGRSTMGRTEDRSGSSWTRRPAARVLGRERDAEDAAMLGRAGAGPSTSARSTAATLLMFPIDREIGMLDRLESLTVELRWKDIAFDRFRLEDDRQHVVEQSQEGPRYRAVVRIEAPKPLAKPARLPISGPEFAADLGESRYIKPHDPKIVATAREVTRGKTDALEAVKAL